MSSEQRLREILRSKGGVIHPRFLTRDPEVSELDGAAIGRLMPHVWRVVRAKHSASEAARRYAALVLSRSRHLPPRYDAATAIEAMESLIDLARADLTEPDAHAWAGEWALEAAAEVVERLAEPVDVELRELIGNLTGQGFNRVEHPRFIALHAIAHGTDQATPDGGLLSLHGRELRLIAELGVSSPRESIVAANLVSSWSDATDDDRVAPPGEYALAQISSFVLATQSSIEAALARVLAIQSGAVPYAADKALSLADAHALGRFASIALDRNERWLPGVLEPLLIGLCVAPSVSVRTAPSQAAAIAIAKAIAERPTIRAFLTLKQAVAETRHAGLQKKLARLAKTAERRLTQRPDFILSIPKDMVLTKPMQSAARRSYEALYLSAKSFTAEEFDGNILSHGGLAAIASNLVWTIAHDGVRRGVLAKKTKSGVVFQDVDRSHVEASSDSMLSLWHPLDANPTEAEAWRGRMVDAGVAQPFNQVFREFYQLDAGTLGEAQTDIFSGYDVEAKVLVGIALSAGWQLSRFDGFQRTASGFRFSFSCGELYPGVAGPTKTGLISVTRNGLPVPLRDINPIVLSEILRSADLMTSVGAFALSAELEACRLDVPAFIYGCQSRRPPGLQTAQRRREVLRRMFGETPNSDRPWVDDRHVCIGDVKIHIATGQARRSGEPITLVAGSAALILPYADSVLQRIIEQANAVVENKLV